MNLLDLTSFGDTSFGRHLVLDIGRQRGFESVRHLFLWGLKMSDTSFVGLESVRHYFWKGGHIKKLKYPLA